MQPLPQLPGLDEVVERLPPFHKVMERCMATMSKPYASAREISTWIESDSALSGKVLSLANSSFYGQPNKVLRTERAVVLLGRRSLEDVFFSFYIQGLFSSQGGSEVAGLWSASLSAGICAKELTFALGLPSAEGDETPDAGAYLAGLLHDAGKLLVLTHYPEAYRAARALQASRRLGETEAERSLWGFDHAELGRSMARKWALPEAVCEAIAVHHAEPGDGPPAVLAALLKLSDLLCAALECGLEAEAPATVRRELDAASRKLLGADEMRLALLPQVAATVKEKMQVYDGLLDTGTWQVG